MHEHKKQAMIYEHCHILSAQDRDKNVINGAVYMREFVPVESMPFSGVIVLYLNKNTNARMEVVITSSVEREMLISTLRKKLAPAIAWKKGQGPLPPRECKSESAAIKRGCAVPVLCPKLA